jgi:hypothetical protein
MEHQKTTQYIVVTPPQATVKEHQKLEKIALFDADGNAIDLAAVLADFEARIADLEP